MQREVEGSEEPRETNKQKAEADVAWTATWWGNEEKWSCPNLAVLQQNGTPYQKRPTYKPKQHH